MSSVAGQQHSTVSVAFGGQQMEGPGGDDTDVDLHIGADHRADGGDEVTSLGQTGVEGEVLLVALDDDGRADDPRVAVCDIEMPSPARDRDLLDQIG